MKFLSKTLILITCGFFLSLARVPAQSVRAYEKAGDKAMLQKDYSAALQYFATALKGDQDKASLMWKYAESARLFHAYGIAETFYQKIVNDKKLLEDYPMALYNFGLVKKALGHYDEAKKYLEQFKQSPKEPEPGLFGKADQAILDCEAAAALSKTPPAAQVKIMGKEVNSPYSEFGPALRGDTLFFTSYRFEKKNDRHTPKQRLAKVMISAKGGRAREPGRGFPVTDTAHIAHTAFSPDGHYVFFTICKNKNAGDMHCELWLTVIDRRNRWLPPLRLPEPINLPGYTTTHPNIGYDATAQGPVLWFASDRPGGKGKNDLWYVPLDTVFFCPCALPLPGKKIPKLPAFANPVNAAAVNTPENDGTPFFDAAKQQLYFSSEGWPGMGGYDVFTSSKKGDLFSAPRNMGPGINSGYNDVYFYLKPDGLSGYLSSNRPGGFFLDEANKACCNDLYTVQFPPPPPPPKTSKDSLNTLAVKPVPVPEPTPVPAPAPAQIKDFVGMPLYFDNDEPDKRTNKTTTKKSYEQTIDAYLERQDEYRERFSAGLSGSAVDQAEAQIDAFFENEVRRGFDRLSQLCDLILVRLQAGETVEVFIKGFTSPRARSEYNINLGRRRISSVFNYLDTYADGAMHEYLKSGKLKVTETSFGETTARAGISDDLKDERNSIYHPDAARERRVEIIDISVKK